MVKYVKENYGGVRDSLLESFYLSEKAVKAMDLEVNRNIIYKDKRAITFEKAYQIKKIKKELI